jgi:hypothetical protein
MFQPKRSLPNLPDLSIVKDEFVKGCRIVVGEAAGPKLSGKKGVIVGLGATRSQLRILLDGSKNSITLYVRFLEMVGEQRTEGASAGQ